MRGQSPFTAMVSTVVLVGILSFSIAQVSEISRGVAQEARFTEGLDAAITVSNDLLADPGYNATSLEWKQEPEHMGLAKYDSRRNMVLDHVLDSEKIAFLEKGGAESLKKYYGLENAKLRIETFSGEVLLDIGNATGNRLQVSRVALLERGEGYERVKLLFAIES